MSILCIVWDWGVVVFGVVSLSLTLAWICYRLLYRFIWSGHVSVKDGNGNPRHVLITGCDSGFGHQLARKMHAAGFHVHAGCLFQQNATQLNGDLGERMHAIRMDVTSERDVKQALETVSNEIGTDGQLWAIVNNAGILGGAHFEWTPLETFDRVMQVNHVGGMRVTKAFLPLLLKSRGRVVNVTSAAGFSAAAGLAPYNCSKFAFEAFSDCLRQEVAPFGVKVSIIEPGFFKTPIVERAQNHLNNIFQSLPDELRNRWGDEWWAHRMKLNSHITTRAGNPIAVVNTLFEAATAKHPLPRYQVGWDCKVLYNLMFHLPTVVKDVIRIITTGPRPAGAVSNQNNHNKHD